jgi:uncharacterized protein YneF (UPF0154 family)
LTPADAVRRLRRFLLAILALGMSGSATELLLLSHFEDAKQLIPLVLIGVALPVLAWHAAAGRAASVRALQLMMVLFIGAGVAGGVLHFRSNMEFQLETDPSLRGRKLYWKVLQAKAPPTLAPGVMVQLGLLGLAYAYRHPALGRAGDRSSNTGE